MKIVYTDSGKQELKNFIAGQQKLLERVVSEQKAVLGDETVEITAADIQAASNRIRIVNTKMARNKVPELVTRFYVVLGIASMAVGFSYPYLLDLYKSNSYQGVFITLGACFSVLGALASTLYSYRRKVAVENEAYKYELKSMEREVIADRVAEIMKSYELRGGDLVFHDIYKKRAEFPGSPIEE